MKSKIFKIKNKCSFSKARTGYLKLPNGVVETPIFMPIGTLGSVKSLSKIELEQLGSEIILGNTYHLWLRPGIDVIQTAMGLHKFSGWEKPILTDSGGFQAFSLGKLSKFTDEGVMFNSHLNGERKFLSPEGSVWIQTIIGSDIALVLDQCLPATASKNEAKIAMQRTFQWARRSKIEFEGLRKLQPHNNNLFGIPQGAQFNDLRRESAKMIMDLDFPGYSIGGVANGGEPEEIMYSQVLQQTEILEDYKPRHLLGVGTPKDIVEMVARGIDMFDCVLPTRNARHGSLFFETSKYEYINIQIKNTKYKFDLTPINSDSIFSELRIYSKAYLRHLFISGELLAYRLATLNNLEFYLNLTKKIRSLILKDEFLGFWKNYKRGEE
jgi:queuine tRNA-ribosyltransferase